MVLDEVEDGQKLYDEFEWFCYACGTCGGLSVLGKFEHGPEDTMEACHLYPKGSSLLPPSHMMSPSQPIPGSIYALYEEVWPLRHRSPSAFVGQIRRLLEFICKDKNAAGGNLFEKLDRLVGKGVFPG